MDTSVGCEDLGWMFIDMTARYADLERMFMDMTVGCEDLWWMFTDITAGREELERMFIPLDVMIWGRCL